ncbi:MAG: GAF domain-containing protein [Rhodocyclaceae bacterium]|nr:GAF domain-containing protein [Rhodocyclaceae bacterium]MBX3667146.1 GAF domain-containing protein [Rhodocyclaceae bacterium]
MKTFIQVTEIWTPSRDRSILEFHDGWYGDHQSFGIVSRKMCFGYGEGLPGKAWAERRPVIFTDLQNAYFLRADAARRAGLNCGVALPVFAGDFLLAVLVFFCASDEKHVGAIELWHNDPATDAELKLEDGYFGIAESFRTVAQNTRFARGVGLPGLAWDSGMPQIMEDLGHSGLFVRSDDARRIGINKGLALPSPYAPGQNYVMTFLSALGTPIARRFEIWVPKADGSALAFLTGECDRKPGYGAAFANVELAPGASALSKCWTNGLPVLSDSIASEQTPLGASAKSAELDSVVTIPVLESGRVCAVTAMYF